MGAMGMAMWRLCHSPMCHGRGGVLRHGHGWNGHGRCQCWRGGITGEAVGGATPASEDATPAAGDAGLWVSCRGLQKIHQNH